MGVGSMDSLVAELLANNRLMQKQIAEFDQRLAVLG